MEVDVTLISRRINVLLRNESYDSVLLLVSITTNFGLMLTHMTLLCNAYLKKGICACCVRLVTKKQTAA
jgi:hypothetical protein